MNNNNYEINSKFSDNVHTKSVFAVIVGRANVGKSSLLNKIVGEKIAIVTSKPQTTRNRITGIVTDGDTQIVIIDTPGMHTAKTKLGQIMVRQARESVNDVDVAVVVVEANREIGDEERSIIDILSSKKMPSVLVLNKIDLLKNKTDILSRIDEYKQLYDFDAFIPMSVLKNEGIDILIGEMKKFAVSGPHFYESDMMTDQPEKVIAGELVREKLLLNLQDEVPHGVGVVVESMKERENGIIDIHTTIYCERKTHKGIIIGKNGSMLKKIASQSRMEMEKFFDTKINLQIWVKVKEDWRNKDAVIHSLGYE